ncbi:MAG: hypothetical protein ACIAQZ_13665 [Sedimentisphaeraceae bacterium JB056]
MEKKTCERCYLNEDYPGISFNDKGICNFCERAMSSEYQDDINSRASVKNIEGLSKIAEEIKAVSNSKNAKYDCVIGASGGFDSTYVIYIVKKLMGLNPLVIKYDNGLCHELANENIKETCRILDVDLRFISVIKSERDYMVNATKSLESLGVFFSACFSCHYILPSLVYKTAREENISYTFSSTNIIEDEADAGSHGFKVKALIKGFFTSNPKQMLKIIYYQILAQIDFVKLKFQIDGFSMAFLRNLPTPYPVSPKWLKKVNVSEYIGWDYLAIMKKMQEDLNWKSPAASKVPLFRWDCYYGALTDKSCQKTVGIGAHAALCNWFVQTGIVSKQDVAEEMKYLEDKQRIQEEIDIVYKKFGLQD